MANKDVLGIRRPGMFENITLPSGKVATPVSGTGDKTTFKVDGVTVKARSANPHEIESRLIMQQIEDGLLL